MTRRMRLAPRRADQPGTHLRHSSAADPFLALGLEATPDLTDDEVRAAWRRVAAASHPDRADGGDLDRFAAAAAAYTALRTRFGRGEALADRRAAPPSGLTGPAGAASRRRRLTALRGLHPAAPRRTRPAVFRRLHTAAPGGRAGRLALRVRLGRPRRLALRALAAAGASAAVIAVAGTQPATPALITGVLTWFVLTMRHDLAPPGQNP